MTTKLPYTAAILSGGKSSRFRGIDKGLLLIERKPLIHRTVELVSSIFEEVLLVSSKQHLYGNEINKLIVPDLFPGAGSLGGIYSAITHSKHKAVFVLPCDMPNLTTDFIQKQIKTYQQELEPNTLIPQHNKFIEPLHAIYNTSLKDSLRSHLATCYQKNSSLKIRLFLDSINATYWELEESDELKKKFYNINSETDMMNLGM